METDEGTGISEGFFSAADFEAIGRLAIACTDLDASLTELIAAILEIHMVDAIILVHEQGFASKYQAIVNLMFEREKGDQLDEALRNAFARSKEIYEHRNAIVHGVYGTDENGLLIGRVRTRGGLKVSKKPFDREHVLKDASEGFRLAFEFRMARRDYLEKLARGELAN